MSDIFVRVSRPRRLPDEIASSISFTAILGVMMVLGLPLRTDGAMPYVVRLINS